MRSRPRSGGGGDGRRAALLPLCVLMLVTGMIVLSDAPSVARQAVAWRKVWSRSLDERAFGPAGFGAGYVLGLSERAVAVARGPGPIFVLDPATGRVRATIQEDARAGEADRIWEAGGTLVVLRKAAAEAGLLSGYDLVTGARSWGPRPGGEVVVSRRAVMVVTASEVTLLDARTGAAIAARPLERGCTATAAAADERVAVLDVCAGRSVQIRAVDPATGRPRWSRELPYPRAQEWPPGDEERAPGTSVAVAADGTVLACLGDAVRLFTWDGARLPGTLDWPCSYGQTIVTSAGVPVVATTRGSFGPYELRGLDPGTGDVRWTGETANTAALLAIGSQVVRVPGYSDSPLSYAEPWPLVAHLQAVDALTGRTTRLPLDATASATIVEGQAGGLVITRTPSVEGAPTVISAYHLVRAPRARPGGVPLAGWPDACALLADRDLRLLGDGYLTSPHPRPPVPRPVSCDWIPPADDGDVVSVTIGWAAASEAEARRTAEEEVRYGLDRTIGTEPGIWYRETDHPAGTGHTAIVSAGPFVVTLHASTAQAVRLLAPRLRDHLRAG
ncbi:PQQ-binding-like beta-propeller repeat protein [Nonomuraea sp. FMUSA5-5]|uniref:PQQ-binding-like beta-propeller repeat protein n=1 Tax=Nonomuraea composti TaxID=2720023 RepID=A0ABX1AT48_9ACTN|nr:PQQ-binding-like beta-propeller repeat protein [Nonomuraea sp. FMUSA5-5]NJP88794.1 PQQ-binding-like beta-propeller repeat protein [Nonomuraea sp. FMUSA5-5]